jgi:hypothetical protein
METGRLVAILGGSGNGLRNNCPVYTGMMRPLASLLASLIHFLHHVEEAGDIRIHGLHYPI